MLPSLEVWIREAKKDFGQLGFFEKVGKKLHGIRAEACNVLVEPCVRVLIS